MTLVYLGGAIDYAKNEDRKGWRDTTSTVLASFGISSYNPLEAFTFVNTGSVELASQLKDINDVAMMNSEYCIFYLPKSVNTVGSIVELVHWVEKMHFTRNNRPQKAYIVVPDVNEISQVSAYLIGLASNVVHVEIKIGQSALDFAIEDIIELHRAHDGDTEFPLWQKHVSPSVEVASRKVKEAPEPDYAEYEPEERAKRLRY